MRGREKESLIVILDACKMVLSVLNLYHGLVIDSGNRGMGLLALLLQASAEHVNKYS